MTSQQQNKKYIKVILIIALLVAGLFYFLRSNMGHDAASDEKKVLKPSQMTFADSNKFREPELPVSGDASVVSGTTTEPTKPLEEVQLQPADQKKIDTLNEILKSKNDNDPRINTELKTLTAEVHRALMVKYNGMAPEDRNGRGTIVFLIARDLKSTGDLDFLKTVYQEQPCLSMGDCQKAVDEGQSHQAGGNEVSMNYPQLVSLYQLDQQLSRNPALISDPVFRAHFVDVIRTAENFAVPQVHDRALQIRMKYGL